MFKNVKCRLVFMLCFYFSCAKMFCQVGIGTIVPDKSSMLDVVSTNKGVLIPRVSLTGLTDITTIIDGNKESLLVYNTSTVLDVRPGYYYWSNNKWNKIAIADDNVLTNVDNGLTASNGNTRLGGDLTVPTLITATATNTLAIKGLGTGNVVTDDFLVVDKSTGILKKVVASQFLKEKQTVIIATNEQTEFNAPLATIDPEKINVFRNGIRIDFTLLNTGVIKLEADVICNQNDEIRIVQFY
jgi:hypothetical protein